MLDQHSKPKKRKKTASGGTGPTVQTLEKRTLFAVTAADIHDTLYVWGDAGGNGISVDKVGSNLVVKHYAGTSLGYVPIFTTPSAGVDKVRVYGNAGNDLLVGGHGSDYLYARDWLAGNDAVYGDDQNAANGNGFFDIAVFDPGNPFGDILIGVENASY